MTKISPRWDYDIVRTPPIKDTLLLMQKRTFSPGIFLSLSLLAWHYRASWLALRQENSLVGQKIPDMVLQTLDGKQEQLSGYRGWVVGIWTYSENYLNNASC